MAVKQVQRVSMRCSWTAGSEEVGLGVALRLCSCIVRVALSMWSCRVTDTELESRFKVSDEDKKATVQF
jgi:hypothetical protein